MNDQQNNTSLIRMRHRLRPYQFFSLVFFCVSTASGVLAFTTAYKAETGYLINSFQKTLLYIVIAASLILAAFATFTVKKNSEIKCRAAVDNMTYLISSLATAYCGAMAVIFGKGAKFQIGDNVITFLKIILLISALAAFLFNPAIWQRNKNRDAFALISGYATVLTCISVIAILYFDISVEMNNPQKLLIQFSAAAVCLSTLLKMKLAVYGKNLRSLIFTRLLSVALCPIAAISAFTAFFAKDKFFSEFYIFVASMLAVHGIMSAIRLFFSDIKEIPSSGECNAPRAQKSDDASDKSGSEKKQNDADPS